MIRIICIFSFLLISSFAWSYPDFIAYGYSTCITCHYNSHGNGPLTDYGRGLFSQEIAARNFWTSKSITDEEIAEKSGFIPGKEMPWWLRPSIKYRGLWFQTNPGSSQSKSKWIHMQRNLDLVLAFNQTQRTILVLNYGLLSIPGTDYYGTGSKIDAVSREHYLRFYLTEKLLVAAGLMDIAYGLRTADHTAFSRGTLGFGQDSQVHGILFHWFEKAWDVSVQGFFGNLFQSPDARRNGVAIEYEHSLIEKDRIGMSLFFSKTTQVDSKRFAIHNRWGFPNSHGSSLLAEIGLKQDQTIGQSGGQDAKLGSYGLIQSVINLVRGFNLITTIERSQNESKFTSPESQRWTFGFLMFPMQRTELRLTSVQNKTFSPEVATEDQWQLQGQLHVSW